MLYRLVTGWYPSKNTAERIFQKIKSKSKNCKIIIEDYCYSVCLDTDENYKELESKKKIYSKYGIYCGIEAIGM